MDDLRNCTRCGRLYEYNKFSNVCPICYAHDEAEFKRIKEYLYEHPFAKIFEVSTNLDIPVSKIKRYLREGRLEIVEAANAFLDCEICGRPIRSGKYCDECFKQENHNMKVVYTGTQAALNGPRVNYRKNTSTNLKKVISRY